MRRNLKILFYASLAVLFSSCENLFKEECEAKGFLSATVSDKGPVPSTTEEIQVRYYDYIPVWSIPRNWGNLTISL